MQTLQQELAFGFGYIHGNMEGEDGQRVLTKKWNEDLACLDPIHFMASLTFDR